MPYRIRPDNAFGEDVRLLLRCLLNGAVTGLTEQPNGVHEAVHEARKKFKRIRNLYRLVGADNKELRRQENARLRDAGRSLSKVRDAAALIETIDVLSAAALNAEEEGAVAKAREALIARRDRIASSETDFQDKLSGVIEACGAALREVDSLSLPNRPRPAARLLAKGWKKGLVRAQTALETCEGSGHGEAFHDLRKAAQAYWMNLSLMRDLWPSAMASKRKDAKKLVDVLGHDQDLSVLTSVLDDEPELCGDGEALSFLLAMIIRCQQQLRREALEFANIVFAELPEREAAIIATLWLEAAAG